MLKRFYPKADYPTVYEVEYEKLYHQGIRGIIFDIDNTLVPYDIKEPTKEIVNLFQRIKDIGFEICLVSNNNKQRVDEFNQIIGLNAIPEALKPLRRNIKRAVEKLGVHIHEAAIIGDQMFTDVWGGNRLGIYTILVNPIQDKEQMITKVKRGIEKQVLKKYLKLKQDS